MLPDPGTLAVFAAAALALLVIPGPAVLYIVAQSISRGRLAGLVSMLGIQVGGLVHVVAAALGLSALLVRSAVAFNVVKFAGAAYLIFLGLRRILGKDERGRLRARRPRRVCGGSSRRASSSTSSTRRRRSSSSRSCRSSWTSSGVGRAADRDLGLVFIVLATLSDGMYALAAGSAAGWLRGRSGFVRGERYATGGVLVGLGLLTAFSGAKSNQ